jgi:transposase
MNTMMLAETTAAKTARQEVYQYAPQRVLLVALDMGKDVHVTMMRTLAEQVLLPPTKLPTLACGYACFRNWLLREVESGRYDLVLVGHEPTGVYHEAWQQQLLVDLAPYREADARPVVRYRLLNPTLVKRERQRQTHRSRKSDALDAQAMTNLLAAGAGNEVTPFTPAVSQLRHTLSQWRYLSKEQKRRTNQLLRTFDRLWPGALGDAQAYARTHPDLPPLLHLVDSRPLQRTTVRLLLEHCPDPYRLRQLGAPGIRRLFHDHGQRCGEATAQRILAVAQQSLLPPPSFTAWLGEQVQADFVHYRQAEAQLLALQNQAEALLPATPAQVLTTLQGVSPFLAARYFATLGDHQRFDTAAQIWAFAGFDPSQHDSGNQHFTGGLSHRGAPFLRATLFQLGFQTSLHCPDCAKSFALARQRGLAPTEAIIHVANKVNRIFFTLLTTQQPFRSALSPAEFDFWSLQMKKRRRIHPA